MREQAARCATAASGRATASGRAAVPALRGRVVAFVSGAARARADAGRAAAINDDDGRVDGRVVSTRDTGENRGQSEEGEAVSAETHGRRPCTKRDPVRRTDREV